MLVKKGAGVVSLMAALQFLLLLRFLTLMSMLLGSPTAQFLVKYTVHISSGVAWSKQRFHLLRGSGLHLKSLPLF